MLKLALATDAAAAGKGPSAPQELVTNGSFTTNSDFTMEPNWAISGGKMVGTTAGFDAFYQALASLTGGATYTISFDITAYTSGAVTVWLGGNGAGTAGVDYFPATLDHVGSFSSTHVFNGADTKQILLRGNGPGFVGSIDNLSVKVGP